LDPADPPLSRQARQPRRQQWRRQHRKQKLFDLLQKLGLLPTASSNESSPRKAILDSLDAELTKELVSPGDHDAHQKLPYRLREMAINGPVTPFQLGRALYHLGQRRGYLSNRKAQSQAKSGETIEEKDFRYPGPKPRT